MSHADDSVHGKLDKLLDSVYNEEHGSIVRLRRLEEAVSGTIDKPGLCEKVRVLQSENLKQTALISTFISVIFGAAWMKAKEIFGHH